jgi:hypothetical protein
MSIINERGNVRNKYHNSRVRSVTLDDSKWYYVIIIDGVTRYANVEWCLTDINIMKGVTIVMTMRDDKR